MSERGYILNIDDPEIRSEEFDRLRTQGGIVTRMMPDLPEGFDICRQTCSILDIACGPGEWAVEIKKRHAHIQMFGGDINPLCVRYAQEQARGAGLSDSIKFFSMDIFQPFDFPDSFFDLVNARFISTVVSRHQWYPLLKEIYRVLKPGGFIRMMDGDTGSHTSPSLYKLFQSTAKIVWQLGKSFNSEAFVVSPMFRPLLHDAGFVDHQCVAYVVDYSHDQDLHAPIIEDFKAAMSMLLKSKVELPISHSDFERLYQQMCEEVDHDDFYGRWYLSSDVARKPM